MGRATIHAPVPTIVGVQVSRIAKNPRETIAWAHQKGIPRQKADRADAVRIVSSIVNAPRW